MKKAILTMSFSLPMFCFFALAAIIPHVGALDNWIWVRNTVTGGYGEAVVGTGDAIYIARKTSFYRYDPADNSWTVLTSPPNPDSGDAFKTGTALTWDFDDHVYALYGAATLDSRRWFCRYSISSNSWEALANTTADQGEGDAMTWVDIDNCIYATIGGEQHPTYFMRYDPSTDSWSDAPADPPAGMGDGASLVWSGADFLYALRGEFDEEEPLYDFWRYSLSGNVWTTMLDIPADGHDGGVGGVGDGGSLLYVGHWLANQTNYVYALSGNQAYPDGIPDNRTYRYAISINSWEQLADLPFGVGHYVGSRLGYADGHIYAWQGTPSTWTGGGDDLVKYEFRRSDLTGHVLVNEVELNPPGNDNYLSVMEWVELYNPTTEDVDVSGWMISTTHGTTVTITISEGTIIPAEGYYVCGRGSQWLDNDYESVVLQDSESTEVDRSPTQSDDVNDDRSWQRYPNGEEYWQFRSSTMGASNGGEAPPEGSPVITILSPENKTYAVDDVPLIFTVDEPTDWIGYSLDAEMNETIIGNTTLTDLLDGRHFTVVYANDSVGNMGSSNVVHFTVDTTPPDIADVSQIPQVNVQPEDEVKVNATVTDSLSGVKQVAFNYTNGNGTWITRNMTSLEPGKYNATVPAFEYCTNVAYVIIAEDEVGNVITTEHLGYEYEYHVIPEFPSTIVPLFLILTTLIAAIITEKQRKPTARQSLDRVSENLRKFK
jgi:hypothetical protein